MNLDEVRELIRLMKENGLAEIDVESGGNHIRLKAEPSGAAAAGPAPQSVHVYAPHPGTAPMGQLPMATQGLQRPGEAAAGLHAGHLPETQTPDHDPGVII